MSTRVRRVISAVLCLIIVFGFSPLNGFVGMKFPKLHLPEVEISAFFDLFTPKAKAEEISSSGTCGNNLTWTLSDNGTLTISGNGEMDDYINYYPGYSTAPWCGNAGDQSASIKSVVVNSGVTSIGKAAFYNCENLSSVSLPSSLISIGEFSFAGCKALISFTVPKNVLNIVGNPLSGCSNIENLSVVNGNPNYKSINNCIINVDSKELISGCLNSIIPSDGSITSIGDRAFNGSNRLVSITIPSVIETVGQYAFSGCSGLTGLTIENGVKTIHSDAFESCSNITSIIIPESVTEIYSFAFSKCSSLNYIKLPGGLSYIGSCLFDNCRALQTVIISEGITKIADAMFRGCSSITSITIPTTVKTICWESFMGCSALSTIVIPSSVEAIEDEAFVNCSNLKSFNVESDSGFFCSENGVLYSKNKTQLISYPAGKTLTSFSMPNNVEIISSYSFYECDNLTNITLSEKVSEIGEYAFGYCSSLTNLTIKSNRIIKCGSNILKGCVNLSNIIFVNNCDCTPIRKSYIEDTEWYKSQSNGLVYLGSTVLCYKGTMPANYCCQPKSGTTSIADYAFYEQDNLVSIILPNSLSYIGSHAFSRSTNLTDLSLGSNLIEINDGAFSGCLSLTYIDFPESLLLIDSYAFSSCSNVLSVNFGNNLEKIGFRAFDGCTSLENVIIPGSLKIWDSHAFQGCKGIKNIVINDGVETIGFCAFMGVPNIQTVSLTDSVTYIDTSAFYSCNYNTKVYYSGTRDSWNNLKSSAGSYNDGFFGGSVEFNKFLIKYHPVGGQHAPETQTKVRGESIKLSASIPDKSFTITYYPNGGELSQTTKKVNCSFKNWNTHAGGNGTTYNSNDYYSNDEDVTLYAQWDYPEAGALSTPYFSGYEFLGWFTDAIGGEQITASTKITRNMDVYAHWNKPVDTHTVVYNYSNNGGISSTKISEIVSEGNEIDLTPVATKSNWEFVGWNIDENATTALTSLNMGVSDVTLFAIYKKTLTGTFIDYSGTTKTTRAATATIYNKATNGTLTPPMQNTYTSWAKRGWATGTAANANAVSSYSISSNTTYYGLYQRTLTLSYNANGGSPTPASQTGTQYVNSYTIASLINPSFTLADAITKSGSTFSKWALENENGIKYDAGDNITINNNTVMIAVWSTTPNGLNNDEIYSFSNSSSSFRTGKYTMIDSDFEILANYIRAYYASPRAANDLINELQEFRNESWGGSCYGMATTVLLDKDNRIGLNENYDSDANNMWEVDAPYQNNRVQSAINYYMISQSIDFTRTGNFYRNSNSSWSAGLKQLVTKAQNGELMLFCYWFSRGGHAIVIKGYEPANDGGYNLIAYDNRYPNRDVIVKISQDYKTCVIDGYESAYAVEFLSDFSCFDLIDIDGPNNDMIINTVKLNMADNYTNLKVVVDGDITISNAEGKTISISEDGTISGNMDIYSTHMIVRNNVDGSPAPVMLSFNVKNSNSYTAESSTENINLSVQNDKIYASVESKNADTIVIGNDEGIYMLGDDIEYSANLSLNNSLADMIELEGESKHNVNMIYNGENIELQGTQTSKTNLIVFKNTTDIDSYEFSSDYNKVLVTNDLNGNINVLASSRNDGNFDIKLIGEEEKVPNPTAKAILKVPSNTEVEYAATITVKATATGVPTGYYVALYDGKTLLKKGSNTEVSYTFPGEFTSTKNITINIIDDNENVQKDGSGKELTGNVEIKAKSGFFAKLIAFFKRLFKALPNIEIKP